MPEPNIVDPVSGKIEPSTIDPSTEGNSKSEIDIIFGSEDPDKQGGGNEPTEGDPFGGTSTETNQDYTGLSSEQLARMFQSKYDKTKADLEKTQKKLTDYESLDDFINSIYEDPEVRHAFISELEPDLVKQKDPYEALEEQLRQEFGQDFVPDDEEAKRPFSKTWRYLRRVDELEKKLTQGGVKLPSSIKELRQERERKKTEATQKALQEKSQVLQTMKWSDHDYQQFAGWVGKLSAVDLAKIYKFANSRRPQTSPNLVNQSGGFVPSPNTIQAEMEKFFGK